MLLEYYGDGYDEDTPHALYSGTKSFWGIAAICAQADGILALDEPVDANGVTCRMLLQMRAGYGFGGLGNAVPSYAKALATPLVNAPGERFIYSGIPLQVFGAHFAAALGARTPHGYLQERVLQPAGVTIARWRTLSDGSHPLPTGAFATARAWLAYGRYVLRLRDAFADALRGSPANRRYGLCWWLAPAGIAEDVFYASGSGGQALYVIPSRDTVAVHFGNSGSYKHEAMLKRLLL